MGHSPLGAYGGDDFLSGLTQMAAPPTDDLNPRCDGAAKGVVAGRHVSYPASVSSPDLLTSYRRAGQASASAASDIEHEGSNAAAFFDVDNTIMRGSSLFHLAVGLAKRKYFNASEISGFARKQLKFVLSGSEDLEDMASATEAALSFVENRSVNELQDLAEQLFDSEMVDKLIPGTLALAQEHLDAGQQVWLVTATPQELARVIAKRLGLTGALGTISESRGGVYTGKLNGPPLHGLAKAEAVRALAVTEGLDLAECSAYSDSVNDVPMLSIVGHPTAVNPDPELRAHALANDWKIRDFRRRARIKPYIAPVATGAAGIAVGVASGYVLGQVRGRR
jgi:HAD superfamily hydrolase (TIGR01490 family)